MAKILVEGKEVGRLLAAKYCSMKENATYTIITTCRLKNDSNGFEIIVEVTEEKE